MRSLTSTQRRVLAEITWNCRMPVNQVAERLRLKTHTVRYAINHLNSLLNLQPFCFSSAYRLGLFPFRVYFSVNLSDKVKVSKMIEHLKKLPEMEWLYGLYGIYQFGMSLRVPSMRALNALLTDFDSKFGDIINKKSISLFERFTYYEPWLAHVGDGLRKTFEYSSGDEAVPLDSVDRNLLSIVRADAAAPVREIARKAGLPSSTVTYRLEKLKDQGVILGLAYTYENRTAGAEAFLIQIAIKGLGGHVVDSFFDFARSNHNVVWAAKMIGEWDVEMEVGVDSAFELDELIHQIYQCGKGSVREVLTHAWGREHVGRSS